MMLVTVATSLATAHVVSRPACSLAPLRAIRPRTGSFCMSQQTQDDAQYAALQKLLTEVSQHSDALESLAAKMEEAAGVEPGSSSPLPAEAADSSDLDAVALRAEQIIEVTKARGNRASEAAADLLGKLAEKEVSETEALKSLRKTEATIASLRAHTLAVETELARLRLDVYEENCKTEEEKRQNEEQLFSLVQLQSDLTLTLTDSKKKLSSMTVASNSLATTLGWVMAAATAPEDLQETARSAAAHSARMAAREMAASDVTLDPSDLAAAEEALLKAAESIQAVASQASTQLKDMKSAGSQEIEKLAAAQEPVAAAEPVAVEEPVAAEEPVSPAESVVEETAAEPVEEPVAAAAEQEFDGVVVPATPQTKEEAKPYKAQDDFPWISALLLGIPPSLRAEQSGRHDRFC